MNPLKRAVLSLIPALLLGAGVAALSQGGFLIGWLSSSLVLWLSLYGLWAAWRFGGGGKTLVWMLILAFILRIGLGIGLNKALPRYGYDTEVQYHGYLFRDAHERDIAAWNLAQSDAPLWVSFSSEIKVDQYGGLLSLSALVYRLLSPDAHRPYLVLILGAFTTAVGLAFFHQAVSQRWNRRLANLAGWILALYPDGILFGSSQMREPFLLGLSAIAFWAVVHKGRKLTRILAFSGSFLGMLLISSRVAVAIAAFLGVWFLIETLLPRYHGPRWLILAAIGLGGLLVLALSYGWLIESAQLDFYLTESSSGWIQAILDQTGENFRIPILVIYGLARPVLPAAIAEPTLPLWQSIGILRSAGWYAIAPLLLYSFISAFKAQAMIDRRILVWTAVFLVFWLLLSSARAGGDAWDNPRYRTAFLPWMALMAGWGLLKALELRDAWLLRWLLVEVIFLGFFTSWYISRYTQWWGRLPFWQMLAWIAVLSALVLSSGFWVKYIRRR